MPSLKRNYLLGAIGVVALVAVACGTDDSPASSGGAATATFPPAGAQPTSAPAATPTSAQLPVVTPTSTSAPADAPAPSGSTGSAGAPALDAVSVPSKQVDGILFNWTIDDIDEGTKPAIALASDGTAHVAYMLEATPGWVKSAQRVGDGWSITEVAKGYYYGPLDIGIGADDQPRVVWHDHQDNTFQRNLGDAIYSALGTDGTWRTKDLFDRGHDGWDTRLFIDSSGDLHVSAIDPEEFGGSGVEYYRLGQGDGSEVVVEQVGSGDLTYRFGTSVGTDSSGIPFVSYYKQPSNDLAVASRPGGEWFTEIVDSNGDTGLFNDLIVGSDDRVHLSYFTQTGDTNGVVKYATRAAGDREWAITEIAELENVVLGFEGARNITSIALDSSGNPWIAFGDRNRTSLAVFDGTEWQIDDIATSGSGDVPQGQQVSLEIDADDRPHLAFFRTDSASPLFGTIRYALGEPK